MDAEKTDLVTLKQSSIGLNREPGIQQEITIIENGL